MMKFAVLNLGALLLSSAAIGSVEGRTPTFALSPRASSTSIESSILKELEHGVKTNNNNNNKVILGLRGGAGPLHAKDFLKVFSSAGLLQGAVMTAGPKVANDLYGIDNNSLFGRVVDQAMWYGNSRLCPHLVPYALQECSLKGCIGAEFTHLDL